MSSNALGPLLSYLSSLEARIAALEGGNPVVGAAPAAASMEDDISKQTAAFDEYLKGAPATLLELSSKIGGDCATLVRVQPTTHEILDKMGRLRSRRRLVTTDLRAGIGRHVNLWSDHEEGVAASCET